MAAKARFYARRSFFLVQIGTVMRSKLTALVAAIGGATVLAVVLGFVPAADAALPAYTVTLKLSRSVSEAGKVIVVAGTVTGPKAAGKTVTIQRQYGGGAWTTVAAAKVSSTGKYSARVETPRGGTTKFRVIKPKSSVRRAGISPTRALKVYEWLYLANEGAYVQGGSPVQPIEQTIGGVVYQRSIAAFSGDITLSYKFAGLCTAFSTRVGYRYSGNGGAPDDVNLALNNVPLDGGATVVTSTTISTGSPITVNTSMVNARFLTLQVTSVGSSYLAALGDPRVYCNADHLPSFSGNDL